MTETHTPDPETADASPLVYVREVLVDEIRGEAEENGIELPQDGTFYAVHTEDGVRRAVFTDRASAFEAAANHGATPLSVH